MWERIEKTMPKFERCDMFDHTPDRTITLMPDSTGVKLDNRGEWIRVEWKVKRGFFKMYILADLDTKRILAFSLTDMKGGVAAQLLDCCAGCWAGTLEGTPPCWSQLPKWY